jgi:tRNA dimethylallyltransferase
MKNILIVVLGPTGVGKTDISVEIASHLNTEIISADSRQFYREMNIGTAVPPEHYLSRVRHHFIRFISVKDYYSSSLFERDVLKLLKLHFIRKNAVLMTGGSGMYIDAVCSGIDDIPDIDPDTREKYNNQFKNEGIESLRKTLKTFDPDYYDIVDLRNHKRIIRALEICETTGRPYSAFLTKRKAERDFAVLKIGLKRERDNLYDRINMRVDEMIDRGLEDEARKLYDLRGLNALKSVGYKEFFEYFEGMVTRVKAVELIKRNSRRYAKRQITWWSRDPDIKWFDAEDLADIKKYIDDKLRDPKSEIQNLVT